MGSIPVRIVYRSRMISLPLLTAIEAADGWEKANLEVERLDYISGAEASDPLLLSGEIDFLFGSHISPYIHRARGEEIVYLGQTVNWTTDSLVTREPLTSLASLRGGRIAEEQVQRDNHPWGNHKLYLQRGGVDLSEIEFVGADDDLKGRRSFELVADGIADAALVTPPKNLFADELGLHVTQLPFLPMVQATTLTTMWNIRRDRPEMCRGVISAVREGIRFLKSQPSKMLDLMETRVGPALGIDSEPVLRSLLDTNRSLLDERLYPEPAAILNAYRIAVLKDPLIQESVNPMELWDIDLLREIGSEGGN